MQLESMMEMYQPMQMQRTQERQRVYTIVDLESLSASALYYGEGSGSSGFSSGGFGGISKKERDKYRIVETPLMKSSESTTSWVKSTDYIKDLPQGQLHVHAPDGIVTGANIQKDNSKIFLSNYEAAMLDLQLGKIRKNTGNF